MRTLELLRIGSVWIKWWPPSPVVEVVAAIVVEALSISTSANPSSSSASKIFRAEIKGTLHVYQNVKIQVMDYYYHYYYYYIIIIIIIITNCPTFSDPLLVDVIWVGSVLSMHPPPSGINEEQTLCLIRLSEGKHNIPHSHATGQGTGRSQLCLLTFGTETQMDTVSV